MSDYGFKLGDKIFTPNNSTVPKEENDSRNRAIEQSEIAHWAGKPDLFVAYVDQDADDFIIVTTWLGTMLGRVVFSQTRTNNFGQRECHIRVEGNNGARYWGRYCSDWSQVVRLRRYRT